MKNRYIFFKRLFKEYVIVFDIDNKYKSLGIDKALIKYIGNNDLNYIIIDNKNNVEVKKQVKNNYKKYVIKEFFKENVGL